MSQKNVNHARLPLTVYNNHPSFFPTYRRVCCIIYNQFATLTQVVVSMSSVQANGGSPKPQVAHTVLSRYIALPCELRDYKYTLALGDLLTRFSLEHGSHTAQLTLLLEPLSALYPTYKQIHDEAVHAWLRQTRLILSNDQAKRQRPLIRFFQ